VDSEAEEQPEAGPAEDSTMLALVEYMARGLVEQPEAVTITTIESAVTVTFELRVAPDDMGKIIGKDGRVAKAMRTLLKVAAAKDAQARRPGNRLIDPVMAVRQVHPVLVVCHTSPDRIIRRKHR